LGSLISTPDAHRPKLIGLLGGECTGKSTLARDLALALDAELVPEALRAFVDRTGRVPRADEQAAIAAAQCALEAAAIEAAIERGARWVVCDPCVLMTAVYSVAYFCDDSLLAPALIHQRQYAVTLWCDVDLPWRDDGQRDGPPYRDRVDQLLAAIIGTHGLQVTKVSGSEPVRLATALAVITDLI